MLTDNLKKYIEIGFHIHTHAYENRNGIGFDKDADRDAFYNECAAVFGAAGWECGKDYCVKVSKGKSSLHIHPQQLLGIVSEDLIEEVRYIIGTAKTFELRWEWSGGLFDSDHERAKVPMIHRMGTKYDITPEQQTEYLVEKRTEIGTCLLERYRTKRRNQF